MVGDMKPASRLDTFRTDPARRGNALAVDEYSSIDVRGVAAPERIGAGMVQGRKEGKCRRLACQMMLIKIADERQSK